MSPDLPIGPVKSPDEVSSLPPAVDDLVKLTQKLAVSPSPSRPAWLGRVSRGERPALRVRRLVYLLVGTAAAIGVVAAAVVSRIEGAGATLSCDVDGGRMYSGHLIESFDDHDARLTFTDGSDLDLTPRSSVRLVSLAARAPSVELKHGEARVHVYHRDGAKWTFVAGPFLVAVKGTSFVLRWNEPEQTFSLGLTSGSVTVTGPSLATPQAVSAGQALTVRLRNREVILRDMDAVRKPDDKPTQHASLEAPGPPSVDGRPLSEREAEAIVPLGRHSREPHDRYGSMLAAGRLDEILRDAATRGMDRVIARSTAKDLEALADAARYRHRYALARQVLEAARKRFPRSPAGERAAYLMARIAQANGDPRSALAWYETYLHESPKGAFVSECLGGKLGLTQSLRGDDAARSVAREYLRRFPSGTYSAAARALMER